MTRPAFGTATALRKVATPPKSPPRPKLIPLPLGSSGKGWHEISPAFPCPKEYQFARIRQIQQRSVVLNDPLSIGLVFHAGRAQWFYDNYKGDLWRERMAEFVKEWNEREDKNLAPCALPIATECMEEYVRYWSVRPKGEVLAIEYELKPRPLCPEQAKPDMAWTWRSARLDSIERWRGKAWIGECKTTSDHPGRVKDLYLLNGQVLLQLALWSEEETAKFGSLGGVLLDIIKKPSGKNRAKAFPREAIPIESVQHALRWFRKDFPRWVMQCSSIQWNDHVERRPVCVRKFGPCTYRNLCLKGKAGALNFVFPDGSPIYKWAPTPGREVAPWE